MTVKVKSDFARIVDVMKTLESQGFVVRMNYGCCGSCAASDLANEGITLKPGDNAVSWHKQNHKYAFGSSKGTMLINPLWLNWQGNGGQIVNAFKEAGFLVQWGGTQEDAIAIAVDMFNRE